MTGRIIRQALPDQHFVSEERKEVLVSDRGPKVTQQTMDVLPWHTSIKNEPDPYNTSANTRNSSASAGASDWIGDSYPHTSNEAATPSEGDDDDDKPILNSLFSIDSIQTTNTFRADPLDDIKSFLSLGHSIVANNVGSSGRTLTCRGNHQLKGSKYAKHATAPQPSDNNKTTYGTNNRSNGYSSGTTDTGIFGSSLDRPFNSNESPRMDPVKVLQQPQHEQCKVIGVNKKRTSWIRRLIGKHLGGNNGLNTDASLLFSRSNSPSKTIHLSPCMSLEQASSTSSTSIPSLLSTSTNSLASASSLSLSESVLKSARPQHLGFISFLLRKLSLSVDTINPNRSRFVNTSHPYYEAHPMRHQESPATLDCIRNGQRLSPYMEKMIYKMSHAKLMDSRRSLREQVIISNLMYWYLSTINNKYHQLQRIIQLQNHQHTKSTNAPNKEMTMIHPQAHIVLSSLPSMSHLLETPRPKQPPIKRLPEISNDPRENSNSTNTPTASPLGSKKGRYRPVKNLSFNQILIA